MYQNAQSGLKFKDSGPLDFGKIPHEATHIDYYLPPAFGAIGYATFDIEPDGFRSWVDLWRAQMPDLSPIATGTIFVPTYQPSERSFSRTEIQHVLVARWGFEDYQIVLGYDEKQQRAYYYYHTR